MKRLPFAVLLCSIAAGAQEEPTSLAETFSMTDSVVKEFEQQGLTLKPEAIADLRWFEKHQNELRNNFKQLKGYEDAYGQTKNGERVSQIRRQKEEIKLISRHIPTYKPSLSFLNELIAYKSGAEFKKSNDWVRNVRSSMETYQSEVGHLVKKDGASGGAAGDGSAPPSIAGNLEVFVVKYSGDAEFYVNDKKVEHPKQGFPLMGVGKFTLRVVGLGAKRKQSKTFQAPTNTTALANTDYQLKYRTQVGTFKGETDWQVDSEKVTWSGPTGGPRWNVTQGNSGKHPKVEGDQLTFIFEGPLSYSGSITDVAKWKATSQRPAGTQMMEQTDNTTASIDLNVSAKL